MMAVSFYFCTFADEICIISFIGTYDFRSFAADDRSILFMGEKNRLNWPKEGARIGSWYTFNVVKVEKPTRKGPLHQEWPQGLKQKTDSYH